VQARAQIDDLAGRIEFGGEDLDVALDRIVGDGLGAGLVERLIEEDLELVRIFGIDQGDHRADLVARVIGIGVIAVGEEGIFARRTVADVVDGEDIVLAGAVGAGGELDDIPRRGEGGRLDGDRIADEIVAEGDGRGLIERLAEIDREAGRRGEPRQGDGGRLGIAVGGPAGGGVGEGAAGGQAVAGDAQILDPLDGEGVGRAGGMGGGGQEHALAVALEEGAGDIHRRGDGIVGGGLGALFLEGFAKGDAQLGEAGRGGRHQARGLGIARHPADFGAARARIVAAVISREGEIVAPVRLEPCDGIGSYISGIDGLAKRGAGGPVMDTVSGQIALRIGLPFQLDICSPTCIVH